VDEPRLYSTVQQREKVQGFVAQFSKRGKKRTLELQYGLLMEAKIGSVEAPSVQTLDIQ